MRFKKIYKERQESRAILADISILTSTHFAMFLSPEIFDIDEQQQRRVVYCCEFFFQYEKNHRMLVCFGYRPKIEYVTQSLNFVTDNVLRIQLKVVAVVAL